jgi:twinkle protein
MNSRLLQSKQPCPSCPSSDAFHVYDDGHGYCFSCKGYFQGKEKFDLSEFTYEYLPRRGISTETHRFYDVKTKINSTGTPVSVGYRFPSGRYKVRTLAEKDFYWEPRGDTSKEGLFGKDRFSVGSSKYVIITEGEDDALSCWQSLQVPAVSVHSSSSARRDCSVDREWLNSYERIYLCFDADRQGRDATRAVAQLFDGGKVFDCRLDLSPRKDATEFIERGEYDELRNIWQAAKRYQPDNIISSTAAFKRILREPKKLGVPYPFPTLNDMTYGIRTGETVLLTAYEKVGKTELMHAIEHNILEKTNANVGAIFIEEPKQRHLQALAGLSLKKPVHLPDCSPPVGEVEAAIEALLRKDDRLFILDQFGGTTPTLLLDTIRYLVTSCNCLYILLDHIHMAVSSLHGNDERRDLDFFTTQLEMMVKELDFALIAVSHLNDDGQTRGSRWLTKVFDITVNAKRNLMHPDPIERNIIDLSIPFSRFPGITGPAGRVWFDRDTYSFKELTDGQASNDNLRAEGMGAAA